MNMSWTVLYDEMTGLYLINSLWMLVKSSLFLLWICVLSPSALAAMCTVYSSVSCHLDIYSIYIIYHASGMELSNSHIFQSLTSFSTDLTSAELLQDLSPWRG